jgi:hypothetical protein
MGVHNQLGSDQIEGIKRTKLMEACIIVLIILFFPWDGYLFPIAHFWFLIKLSLNENGTQRYMKVMPNLPY